MIIWDGLATASVPDSFIPLDDSEKRQLFGMGANLPQAILKDDERGITLQFSSGDGGGLDHTAEDLVQEYNHIFARSLPGYKCLYASIAEEGGIDFGVIQYAHFVGEMDAFSIFCAAIVDARLLSVAITGPVEQTPQIHDDMVGILNSISIANRD